MKQLLLTCIFIATTPMTVNAQTVDIIGGPAAGTQTMHHCGFLPVSAGRYTNSPVTIRIIEQKLVKLGFLKRPGNGTYSKADKAAVIAFQRDEGLSADGIVGPRTAQHLAYRTHPSAHVRSCQRMASSH